MALTCRAIYRSKGVSFSRRKKKSNEFSESKGGKKNENENRGNNLWPRQ